MYNERVMIVLFINTTVTGGNSGKKYIKDIILYISLTDTKKMWISKGIFG